MRVLSMAMIFAICGILISTTIPSVNAIDSEYMTGFDGIWLEEGPWLQYDDQGRQVVYQKIGYTHLDRSKMSISILTPVYSGGNGYVIVIPEGIGLEPSGWNVPWSPHAEFIEYTFHPGDSIDYYNSQGMFVNPLAFLRYHMESTTSGVLNIDVTQFPWGP